MLTEAERERMAVLKTRIKSEMEKVRVMPECQHPDSAYEALDALVNHIVGAFGWRELDRDDDGNSVTLFNGRDWLDIRITPDEDRDAISERSNGAFEEREFNDND